MIQPKRNLGNKKTIYGYGIFISIFILLAFIYHDKLKLIYSNPETVKQFITGFDILAPIILILLLALQIIIFVIPGPIFIIAGGYAFGTILGGIYSLIGVTLGSIFVFYLSKKFGRPFVVKMVNKRDLEHFDVYFKKKGKLALFISRVIPILFPIDVVSFAAGLTSLSYKDYIIMSFLGFIPQVFILTFFGDKLSYNFNPFLLIILAILGLGVLVYLFRHPIKILLIKEVGAFERKLRIIEEKSLKEVKIIEKGISHDYNKIKTNMELVEKISFHNKRENK